MAVASASHVTAETSNQIHPSSSSSSSKLESESATLPTNLTKTDDTPDRGNQTNPSSNAGGKDAEIQVRLKPNEYLHLDILTVPVLYDILDFYRQKATATVLRSEEYRQLFRLPPDEVLIEDFNCALQENLLIQGHMYLFVHFICFYSNIFGFETKKIIPFNEVTSVRRAKTAGIFPNAIEILAGSKKYFFASFLSRDEAFKIVEDGWLQHGNNAKAIIDEQGSASESSGPDNADVVVEKGKGQQEPEVDASSSEISKESQQDLETPSNIEDDPAVASDLPNSFDQGADQLVVNYESSAMSFKLPEEDIDAPKTPEVFTNVAESKFPIKVEDFFRYFFSDDAAPFLESFRKRCGDKDFKCTSWKPHEKFGYTREVSFQHPIKVYLGAKCGGCHELQKARLYRNGHLVIETIQDISDVPYADYFQVEGLWDVQREMNGPKEFSILRIYVNVAFSKKTIWKGKIVQSTVEECREAYAIWLNMAHELLMQKNLEQQESGAPSSIIENSEVPTKGEIKMRGSSEILQEPSNSRMIPPISDTVDLNRCAGRVMQGTLVDTMSLASLLREFMVKLRSALKSQSHLSLLLVTVFAVIFLMQQLSILVLLARPQHIHLNNPANYMFGMEDGVRVSSSDTVGWLEKRIHHLKDEMYMVETRLERMRYEHALLKKQLKDLENR